MQLQLRVIHIALSASKSLPPCSGSLARDMFAGSAVGGTPAGWDTVVGGTLAGWVVAAGILVAGTPAAGTMGMRAVAALLERTMVVVAARRGSKLSASAVLSCWLFSSGCTRWQPLLQPATTTRQQQQPPRLCCSLCPTTSTTKIETLRRTAVTRRSTSDSLRICCSR
jgi:hypothetical protein